MLFRHVTRIPAKDNDGADGHFSDSSSKLFVPRFRTLGDPCFFHRSVSFTVESNCEVEKSEF